MKKLLMMAAAVVGAVQFVGAQSGPKWATGGNSTGPNAFLGTTNNRPLNFKTNGLGRMKLTANGWLGVGTSTPGYLLDVAGTVNAQDYLISGNPLSGAFLPISGGTLTGDLVLASGANLKTGSSNAGLSLEAFGFPACIQLGQELTGTGLQQLKLVPASAAVVVLPNSPDGEIGLVDENPNGTIKLKTGTNANEIRALTINGRVGVGGNQKVIELKNHTGDVLTLDGIAGPTVWDAPQGVEINGDLQMLGKTQMDEIEVTRITSTNDSVIAFGDSTMYLAYGLNWFFYTPSSLNIAGGLRVGNNSLNIPNLASRLARGLNSTAIGFDVATTPAANNAITLGSGLPNAPLTNSIPNSLAVGFNSTSPTLTVTPGDGTPGSIGQVIVGGNNPSNNVFEVLGDALFNDDVQIDNDVQVNGEVEFGGSRLHVGTNGLVGIGTTNPINELHIEAVAGSGAGVCLQSQAGRRFSLSSTGQIFTLFDVDNGINRFVVDDNGNVGIGTATPAAKLHVDGDVQIDGNVTINANANGGAIFRGNYGHILLSSTGSGHDWAIQNHASNGALEFRLDGNPSPFFGDVKMILRTNGKLGIGTTDMPGNYKLYVADGVLTERVKVAVESSADWADHVLKSDYVLAPIKEARKYVERHGHLRGVPSAESVVEQGIDLGKMDATLLAKIEENRLYLFQAFELIEQLQKENEVLKQQLAETNKNDEISK